MGDRILSTYEVREKHEKSLKKRLARLRAKDADIWDTCLVPLLEHEHIPAQGMTANQIWQDIMLRERGERERILEIIDTVFTAYDEAHFKIRRIKRRRIAPDEQLMVRREIQQAVAGNAPTRLSRWAKNASYEELIGDIWPKAKKLSPSLSSS